MNLDEVPTVIDVHPPHEPIHGWRDFLLHLLTITIGLLIALSLEGCVEWRHHRHLVHEAEASLHAEIQSNAMGLPDALATLHKNQADLKHDVDVLKYIIKNHKTPPDEHMEIAFGIRAFDDVSWKTAQSTTALSYMPYSQAEEYSDIYNTQNELNDAERQAARDAIISLAPFMNTAASDPDPTEGQANDIKQKIEVLQGQLTLVESFMKSLDQSYKKFLAAHPD
ncbi:hypothetical protein [Tunturibacter empetritectus]|uniref:Uncharacterized protein n=1 Tax=Tunturiibacter lichenicola TaxID=2051959 RepID=A0A7W8J962_9BACT|nr:hypothetical protein [Edaphobacter lichenicola]MBB5344949.1 hypothetical protein [Edaphobacter lichenicola]